MVIRENFVAEIRGLPNFFLGVEVTLNPFEKAFHTGMSKAS